MDSEGNHSLFAAWSPVGRQAREAERQFHELILTQGGRPAGGNAAERTPLRTEASIGAPAS